MLHEMKLDQRYAVSAIEDILTPALLLYPEEIANNIERTLALLSADPNRWRVHIKTAKLSYTLKMLLDRGVQNFKCATTLELLTACRTGVTDVLLAYPAIGANARRTQEIAQQFPEVRISVLVESEEQLQQWRTSRAGIFLDINPGMNRTGIDQSDTPTIIAMACAIITAAGLGLFAACTTTTTNTSNLAEPERTHALPIAAMTT